MPKFKQCGLYPYSIRKKTLCLVKQNMIFSKIDCECNVNGSLSLQCNSDGKCACKDNVSGDKCDIIAPGWWDIESPKGILQ